MIGRNINGYADFVEYVLVSMVTFATLLRITIAFYET